MAFKPIRYDSGKVKSLPMAASMSATKHQLCKMSSGYLADAVAGDNEVEYIALETKTDATATNAGSYLDVLPIDDEIDIEALTSIAPVQATHVGNDYDLTDLNTVDLDNITDKVFHIDEIVDATNKLVRGHFNKPAIA